MNNLIKLEKANGADLKDLRGMLHKIESKSREP